MNQTKKSPPAGNQGTPDDSMGVESTTILPNPQAWETWHAAALDGLAAVARTRREFTTQDLRDHGIPEPDRPQHWAVLFALAERAGVISRVGWKQIVQPCGQRKSSGLWTAGGGAGAVLPD